MRRTMIFGLGLIALSACGQANDAPMLKEMQNIEVSEAPPNAVAGAVAPVAGPQIAYSYTYGYRLDVAKIDAAQASHIALCDKLGRARCRIANMRKTSGDGDFSSAALTLLVDARVARAFGGDLDKAVAGVDGETSDRAIEAEDLSKAMIDTGARIRAKQALADRLLSLIQTRSGSVADLVAAERAFADAQEELDAARSTMADMQSRVALSKIEIGYSSRAASGGFMRPVRDAFAQGGRTMGASLAALLNVLIVIAPWLALLAVLLWLKRKLGWSTGVRWPWRREAVY